MKKPSRGYITALYLIGGIPLIAFAALKIYVGDRGRVDPELERARYEREIRENQKGCEVWKDRNWEIAKPYCEKREEAERGLNRLR